MTTATAPRLTRRTYVADKDRYWEMIEANRTNGRIADWAFDFISIHDRSGEFSLVGPLLLVDPRNTPQGKSRRPRFESKTFANFESAKAYALRLVCKLTPLARVHVISCC